MKLELYDSEHNFIDNISREKDLKIERWLKDGSEILSFSCLIHDVENITEEMYLRTSGDKENEYVIKEIDLSDMPNIWITAKINLEGLQKPVQNVSAASNTIDVIVNALLDGTGWTADFSSGTAKKRALYMENTTIIDVLDRVRTIFLVEMLFDAIHKKITIKEKFGEDRGVHFLDGINLKSLRPRSDTNDFCTRIIPIGNNGMTISEINNGKNYIENYSFSKKVKTIIWQDNNYEDVYALKEDAEYKLNELCRPKKSYTAEVADVAKMMPDNKEYAYDLGDTITIASERYNIRDKQRIVKMTEYPDEPTRNTVELGSTIVYFEDINKAYTEAVSTLKSVTKSGIIVGNKVFLPDGKSVSDAIEDAGIRIDVIEEVIVETGEDLNEMDQKLKLSQEEIDKLTNDVGVLSEDMQDALARTVVEISDTEPEVKYIGMLWKHTGTISGLISGATYRWDGSKWQLYLFAAENISVRDLAALGATIGGWLINLDRLCCYNSSKRYYPLILKSDGIISSYDSTGDIFTIVKNGYIECGSTTFNNEYTVKVIGDKIVCAATGGRATEISPGRLDILSGIDSTFSLLYISENSICSDSGEIIIDAILRANNGVTVNGKPVSIEGHTHSEYASSNHTHSDYLPISGGTISGSLKINTKLTNRDFATTDHNSSKGYSFIIYNGDKFDITEDYDEGDATASTRVLLAGGRDNTGIFLRSYPVYNRTYSSGKTVTCTNAGTFGIISSSSIRYKHDVKYFSNKEKKVVDDSLVTEQGIDERDLLSVLDIPVVSFLYNEGYINGEEDFDYKKPIAGFIADDVASVCPDCATYLDLDGEKIPESWDERQMIPRMLYVMQKQQKQIDNQQKQIDELKEMIGMR